MAKKRTVGEAHGPSGEPLDPVTAQQNKIFERFARAREGLKARGSETFEAAESAAGRLDAFFAFVADTKDAGARMILEGEPTACEAGRAIVEAEPAMKGALIREIAARLEAGDFRAKAGPRTAQPTREDLERLLIAILGSAAESEAVADFEPALVAAADHVARVDGPPPSSKLIDGIRSEVREVVSEKGGLSAPAREALGRLVAAIRGRIEAGQAWKPVEYQGGPRLWLEELEVARTDGLRFHVQPGEAWSDAAIADIEGMPAGPGREAWVALMRACDDIPSGKKVEKWLADARKLVDRIGRDDFRRCLLRWFPLVDRPRTAPHPCPNDWDPDWTHLIVPEHRNILWALVRLCSGREDRDLARALARLAVSSYRKVPKIGPRLVSLGNACVSVLGTLPGIEAVGQLAMLKTRVKFGTALKEVEKAFDAAARRENLPREEIEELGVPTYGMEEVGRRVEAFGDYTAEMAADGDGFSIAWSKADGSPLKSVPASIKKDHAEEWKELQAAAKDAGMMLTSRRDALDSSYLARKTWPLAAWRERYLDHPLVGVIASRLIWTFTEGKKTLDAFYHDGRLVDREGRAIEEPGGSTTVALWHPIGRPVEEVLAWRDLLERLGVKQPFKQAHREVYLLTDAERRTGTYSNRFAAHVLKQHQFHALCAARGWKNRLRMSVDDSYPPATRTLPAWNLRAEFWVEKIGDEVNESYVYLYLATDQVRFYPIDAAQAMAHASGRGYRLWNAEDRPMALEDVPPMVLSEILRDVDLFVGVASVGNDPTWSDGGPRGRYVDYWQRFSFGTLSATAQTRKAVLERLVPRLKIADRCEFSDKFLIVRGDLRTYKIHLGSGNILMEPNDQYLCIVPKQVASSKPGGKLFLPFEGDAVLSVVLSKALMLADDRKIKDETITRQIDASG